MKLTEKQELLLKTMAESGVNSYDHREKFTDIIAMIKDFSHDITPKSHGIATSLRKKGLVDAEDNDKPKTYYLTQDGLDWVKENG